MDNTANLSQLLNDMGVVIVEPEHDGDRTIPERDNISPENAGIIGDLSPLRPRKRTAVRFVPVEDRPKDRVWTILIVVLLAAATAAVYWEVDDQQLQRIFYVIDLVGVAAIMLVLFSRKILSLLRDD